MLRPARFGTQPRPSRAAALEPVTDLHYASATDVAAAIRAGEVSAREALVLLLDRVRDVDGPINAVVETDIEAAAARAAAADKDLAGGEWWGPLHGVPMTVKDSWEVAGMPTTSGSPTLAAHVPERHAPPVQRLVDAGAIVFGKTNLPLWAGDLQSYNEVHGTTNNPWDPTRTPGGSSGGSAAALAAGLTPLELGSDIAGSIRNPAHFCGVYGHKPTYGIVPMRGHIPGPPGMASRSDLSVGGPLARSAADLALALDVLAGPDEDDAAGWRLELPPPRHDDLGNFRVAAWLDHERCPVDPDVAEVLEAAVAALEAAGVAVDREARPDVDPVRSDFVYQRLLTSVTSTGFSSKLMERYRVAAAALDPDDRSAEAGRTLGAVHSHRDWISANESRHRMRRAWAAFFRDHDVLLTPAMPTVAFPHDHSRLSTRSVTLGGVERPYFDQVFWSGLATVAYLPATVAPAGLAKTSSLPVGIQVIGPYLEDRTTIEFARLLAEVIGGFVAPPPVAPGAESALPEN